MEQQIKEVMAKVFNQDVNTISPGSSVDTVRKWDSLGHLNLVVQLEKKFNIKFSDEQIFGMRSFNKVFEAVSSLIVKK